MYDDLTKRQQEVLEYVLEHQRKKGYPPSVREIGQALGLRSSSTVHGHLYRLEKKGYIKRDPSKPRALELRHQESAFDNQMVSFVPVVGTVTAGEPILAIENVEYTFPLPRDFTHEDQVFMLRIKGDSMIEAGIFDGDYVIVRQQATADNGDVVVALVEDEATVKRFYKEQGYFRLQPENQFMEPIIVDSVEILGKVTGLVRKF